MKICWLYPLDTSVILESILKAYQIYFGINFGGFKF